MGDEEENVTRESCDGEGFKGRKRLEVEEDRRGGTMFRVYGVEG
jgi:hypothetical protein